ncbi:siphovirus Gp157 family protein [Psychrobacter cibarius]|nr:siphovirus Gp157 family protein [Psychrobacter cibarius]
MATIYELTDDYTARLTKLGYLLQDGQEVSNEQAIALLDLQDNIGAKVVNIGKYVKNLDASSSAISAEVARLQARKRGIDNHIKALKDAAIAAMELLKIDKVHDDIMPVRLQANSQYSVTVENPNSLPSKYQVLEIKADKKALLADKDSLDIQGVTITKGQHIRFG